jgi:ClpP class serine protease
MGREEAKIRLLPSRNHTGCYVINIPASAEIGGSASVDTIKCNGVIEHMLGAGNAELAKHFSSDVIFLKAPMRQPIDDIIKDEIEELRAIKRPKGKSTDKLIVLVETNGGSIEVVERMVSVFRKHYALVEYIVPNYAYSAGTILVLSGDELYMDYYSILGPIDPQMDTGDG